jgi:thiamine kinase-like enzyme
MEWLDGETLGSRIVKHEDFAAVRPRLARQCGEILARIHALDLHAAGLDGALARQDTETLVRQLWSEYQRYRTPQPMIDYTARWLLAHLPPTAPPRLVHNDFRNGNLMVSPQAGVVAVLDWELAYLGDPLRDLGWLCTNSWRFGRSELPVGGFGTIEDLLAGYAAAGGGRVEPEPLRWWIVFGSFWWSVGTLAMTQAYRSGLDRSVERVAIGRRSSECQVDCVNLLIPGPVERPTTAATLTSVDAPSSAELIGSVRDFLRDEMAKAAPGRAGFMARVASNSLDIVQRELELGAATRDAELCGLARVLGHGGEVEVLRSELAAGLRDGSITLDRPGLAEHLRNAVVARVAIDQPTYSGLATALRSG